MSQTAQSLLGMGATLSIGTQTDTPTYTVINGVKKVSPPKPKWGTEDVTTLNTASATRVFIKTLLDPGEVTIDGEWQSADPGQVALSAALNSLSIATYGQVFPFKLALPPDLVGGQVTTGDTVTFNALVTDWAVGEVEVDKVVTFASSLKITGPITYVEGA
jgi:hypothetical protein